MSGAPLVFDRKALSRQRARRAGEMARADFLLAEVVARLLERLEAIRRPFTRALDLACHDGRLAAALARGGEARLVVRADAVAALLRPGPGLRVACDEELLPFAPASFELVVSALGLHWVNDLPGTLLQIRRCLAPDGLLLAAMPGGDTLVELREVLALAELEITGGAGARVAPAVDLRDLGGLLQRTGFALPVVDRERITVTYAEPLALLDDLRRMGAANVLRERSRRPLRRDVLLRARALYLERYALPDGRVPATFELLWLAAWAPHEAQQRPLRPGSATTRLAAALTPGAERQPG